MSTYLCSTNPDPEKREDPEQKSSVMVLNRWTQHAYKMAHDHSSTIVYEEDGFTLVQGSKETKFEMDLRIHAPREFMYSPDSKRVAFWAPRETKAGHISEKGKKIAVMNVGSLGSGPKAPYKLVYKPEKDHHPFGLEWSPDGKYLFVIEQIFKEEGIVYTRLFSISMPSGGKPVELVRLLGVIDFFMPPVSRFENGGGTSGDPYDIIFGAKDGLYLIEPTGKNLRRLSKVPAMGLHNLEWNPDPKLKQVILFFRYPTPDTFGRKFQGVYLVHIDQAGENPEGDDDFIEHLYDGTDIHTLWYSPKGTYVTWAHNTAVWFRKPMDPPENAVKLELLDEESEPVQIRGVSWNAKETKLAFTAQGHVMVYDLKEKDEEKKLYPIHHFPIGFGAEPVWVGDSVYLTVVENIGEELKELRSKATIAPFKLKHKDIPKGTPLPPGIDPPPGWYDKN